MVILEEKDDGDNKERRVRTSHPKVDLTPPERWHLHFFHNATARLCGAYYHDEFWHGLIHQLSEEHPAVRYAVIAMSARQTQFERVQLRQATETEQQLLSLKQCNKAIASLRKVLEKEPPGVARNQIVLTTCAILVYLALFEDDPKIADYHFHSGYRLLLEWQKDDFGGSSSGPVLMRTFAQLQLHRSTCTNPTTFVEENDPSLLSPVVEDSRPTKSDVNPKVVNHFITVLGWILLQNDREGFTLESTGRLLRSGEPAVLGMLRLWRTQLKRSVLLHGDDVSQTDRDTLSVLSLWSEVIYIKLSTNGQPALNEHSEMRCDHFLSHFQRVVVLAKSLLMASKSSSVLSDFPVKGVIIPPLLFCGFKCRDWQVRRQVRLLLQDFKDHEDVWVSGSILALEEITKIESKGIAPGEQIPDYARVDSMRVDIHAQDSQVSIRYRRSQLPPDESGNSCIIGDGMWENRLLSISTRR
ncbi:uncharacterized protein BHQ10_009412 [Talaromyces amestolkiae]|uniref:Uncharacterized protein n=1 Tax=Talaromyces amestolkiae TaxID=1196081 RepID=A0A364LC46_TALAM|nr:uncharacterized protein BHQ10_009412 [Talaromyces amestolkiae]RAO73400.1 hypothetical protein BHQ10_009412 [Talaromyces amestolkiae]